MANTTAFAGDATATRVAESSATRQIYDSIKVLLQWLEGNQYRGYDTFDGLNAFVRPLMFNNKLLQTMLQQGVRRFPINLRPILGISKSRSTKGMGFLARGFIRLHQATGEPVWAEKAEWCLEWLIQHQATGYSGSCWGNHFDYQSRSWYLPKGVPTIVWTSLIGHAFLDAYQHFGKQRYLEVATSACQHIVRDLATLRIGDSLCISYVPHLNSQVHNANTLGGSLLARTYSFTGTPEYRERAEKAILYTAIHQRSDASWWYGERENLHWVDNFHTAYVLDCFKHYQDSTGDDQFEDVMSRGYNYWKRTFFLSDGTPRYYDFKTLPIDIQCCSQAVDTLVLFKQRDPEALPLALKTAQWTIRHMQDESGYFYYRRYGKHIVNKTPTLHWGQATMMSALAALYQSLL
jgi:polysaccharide biosynthesis protein VpsJ